MGQQVEDKDKAEGQTGPRAQDLNLVGHRGHSVRAGQLLSIPIAPSLLTHPLLVSQRHVQDSTVHVCTAPFGGLEEHTAVAQETPYGKHRRRCGQGLPVESVWVAAGKTGRVYPQTGQKGEVEREDTQHEVMFYFASSPLGVNLRPCCPQLSTLLEF